MPLHKRPSAQPWRGCVGQIRVGCEAPRCAHRRAFGKERNAANRLRPVDRRPQGAMQRVRSAALALQSHPEMSIKFKRNSQKAKQIRALKAIFLIATGLPPQGARGCGTAATERWGRRGLSRTLCNSLWSVISRARAFFCVVFLAAHPDPAATVPPQLCRGYLGVLRALRMRMLVEAVP